MSASTEFMLVILAGNVLQVMIFAGLPILLMWIIGRYVRRWAAIAIGLLTAAFVVYGIVDEYRFCNAPPVYVPSGDSEAAIFHCDGPLGSISYLFIWRSGPISTALLLSATSFQLRRWLRQRKVERTGIPASGV